MNFLELKPLTENLLPAAVELDRLCLGGLWSLAGYQRELASPNSDLLVLSISQAEVVGTQAPLVGLGCLWAILEEAHITVLAVDPNYQRQGLGRSLLFALLSKAVARGLERATLEVRASNQPALFLYEKFGFQVAGRRRGYYRDNDEDALILWRNGLHYPEFKQTLTDWERQIGDRLALSGWKLSVNISGLTQK